MEKQHAAGYARIPSDASDLKEWESEQVWPADVSSEETLKQTATNREGTKTLEEALEQAAEIRHSLEGRPHSDSTQLIAKDRQR